MFKKYIVACVLFVGACQADCTCEADGARCTAEAPAAAQVVAPAEQVDAPSWHMVHRGGQLNGLRRAGAGDTRGDYEREVFEYIRVRYDLDRQKCANEAQYAQELEKVLYKTIDMLDIDGADAVCYLIKNAHANIGLRAVLKHFDHELGRKLRGKFFKAFLAGVTGIGLGYLGLKMLHKPSAQITERAGRCAAVLLGGAGLAGCTSLAVGVADRNQLKYAGHNVLAKLLESDALIVGGDEREIEHALARIVNRLN